MCSLLFSIIVFCNASMAMQPGRSYSIEEALNIHNQSGWTLYIINSTSLALRLWIIPKKEILSRTYNPAYLASISGCSDTVYHIRKSDKNKNPYILRVLCYKDDSEQEFLNKADLVKDLDNDMFLDMASIVASVRANQGDN